MIQTLLYHNRMNNTIAGSLSRLRELDRERMHLNRVAAILQWDQETFLPPDGVEERAEQLAVVEGLAHEKLINPEIGELLEGLADSSFTESLQSTLDGFPAGDFIRVLRRDYERAVKLPVEFVRESARAEGISQAEWIKSRKQKDFSLFAPHLEKMIGLTKKKAELWGWEKDKLYDGCLDFYEPGFGSEELKHIFDPLKERLRAFLEKIAHRRGTSPDHSQAGRGGSFQFDKQQQDAFCRELLAGLGFNSNRGRLDCSVHPFTSTLGWNDVRITTRYSPEDPMSGIFSVIHESGHAFYEMGIDSAMRYSCLAEGTSMGIHESQSRLWENVIGRSRAFWKPWFPRFQEFFPHVGTDFEDFYRTVNSVVPGPIRVEADEVSYSLHIILRFELEEKLFSGKLTVNDLPAAWNAALKNYCGVEISDDAEGVLQDVHLSMGAFGYFPSYALGNLYALQFWEKLLEDLPADTLLEQKEYGKINSWLREHIHCKGRSAEGAALIKEITGRSLSEESFLNYIEKKYSDLYGL